MPRWHTWPLIRHVRYYWRLSQFKREHAAWLEVPWHPVWIDDERIRIESIWWGRS